MDVITSCPDEVARTVLIALCDDKIIRMKAISYINKLQRPATGTAGTAGKRKASDELRICIQCQEPFTDAENSSKACRWHDGM